MSRINYRPMDSVTIQRLKEVIDKAASVGISVGKNATIDEMGAALALYLGLTQAQKSVIIASATDPLVEVSSLVGIDKVKTNLEGSSGDLVVSFPYKEGEIEKVSYTIENGYLNIVVKAGPDGLSFSEKDVRYKRGGAGPSLLFIVGTPRLSDLGNLFNPEALKNTTIVNIDNKTDNQGFGDIVLVYPNFSSVSESVASILVSLGISIDQDIAQNLMSGILYATDNFQKENTSYLAFEMAAFLLKKGATRGQARFQRPSEMSFSPQPQAQSQRTDPFRALTQTQRQSRPSRLQTQEESPYMSPTFRQQMMSQNTELEEPVANQPIQSTRPQTFSQPQVQVQQSRQQAPREFPKQPQQAQPSEGQQKESKGKTPPPDWLVPKVYRGSSES